MQSEAITNKDEPILQTRPTHFRPTCRVQFFSSIRPPPVVHGFVASSRCRVHAPTANATELWCSHPVLLRSSALNSQPSGLIAPSPPPPARPPDVHLRVARCPSAVRCVIGTCFPDRAGTLDSLAQTKKHPKERRPAVAPTEGCSPVLRAMLFSSLGWEAGPPHTLVIPTDSEGAVRLRRSGGTPTDASFAMLLQGVQPTLFLFNRLQSRNDERTQGEGLRTLK